MKENFYFLKNGASVKAITLKIAGGRGEKDKITFQITDTKFCVTFLKVFSERALFKIAETNLNTWRRKVIGMDHYSKFVQI